MTANGGALTNKWVKYIIIAFVLALVSNAVIGWILQTVSELREQVHDLDTDVAVMKDRLSYVGILEQKNITR